MWLSSFEGVTGLSQSCGDSGHIVDLEHWSFSFLLLDLSLNVGIECDFLTWLVDMSVRFVIVL